MHFLVPQPTSLRFDAKANLTQAQLEGLVQLLQTCGYDLSGCMTNCSNQGACNLNPLNQHYGCECNANFTGTACQTNLNPCSSSPCMNNGNCSSSSDQAFVCQCSDTYFGANCEEQINVCQNKTCVPNGICLPNGVEAKCKCFVGYSGDSCSLEDESVKITKAVKLTSLLVAIFVMIATALIIIANDILTCLVCPKETKKKRRKQKYIIHFKYKN